MLIKKVDYLDLYLMHFPTAFVKGDGNVPRNADGTVKYGTTHYKVSLLTVRQSLMHKIIDCSYGQ